MLQRASTLFLLPLYTRAITPAEYGVLGLLTSLAMAAQLLLAFGLEAYVTRSYFHFAGDPIKQQRLFDSVWRFLVVVPLAATIATSLIAWPLLGSSRTVTGAELFLALVSTGVFVAATALPLTLLRVRQDLRGYIWMSGTSTLLVPLLTWLFVVPLDQGVIGWFVATSIANSVTLVVAFKVVPWNWGSRFSWPLVRTALAFSVPLLPHTMSHWVLQVADRLVLAGLVSAAELGIYTVAASLAAPTAMLMMAINQACQPSYAHAGATPGTEDRLAAIVVVQVAAVIVIAVAGAALGPPLVKVLTTAEYSEAAPLVPWIVLGYAFLGLYYVPISGAILGAGRRTFAWIATVVAGASNILIIVLTVPTHGVQAAAIASAAGYFVLLVLIAVWAHSGHNPVRYEWHSLVPIVLGGLLTYGICSAVAPSSPVAELALRTACVSAFVVVLGWLLVRNLRDGLSAAARIKPSS